MNSRSAKIPMEKDRAISKRRRKKDDDGDGWDGDWCERVDGCLAVVSISAVSSFETGFGVFGL